MEYQLKGGYYFVRIDRGEEIVAGITALCEKEGISAGLITGIGAVNHVQMGLFRTAEKRYISKEFTGDFEIVSLTGNITQMDGKPYLHLHIAVADESLAVKGGHLNKAVVSATGELVIVPADDSSVGRAFSEDIGLNLLQFTWGEQ